MGQKDNSPFKKDPVRRFPGKSTGEQLNQLANHRFKRYGALLGTMQPLSLLRIFYMGLASVVIAFLVNKDFFSTDYDYREGEIAASSVISQRSFEVVDPKTTEENRTLAKNSILPIYDYHYKYGTHLVEQLSVAFQHVRDVLGNTNIHHIEIKSDEFRKFYKEFEKYIPGQVTQQEFYALLSNGMSKRLERVIMVVLAQVRNRKIVADVSRLKQDAGQSGIKIVRQIADQDGNQERSTEETFNNINDVIEVADLRENVRKEFQILGKDFDQYEVLEKFVMELVRANLDPNFRLTQDRRKQAVEEVYPATFRINKGEKIVNYGERVSYRQALILSQLKNFENNEIKSINFILIFAILFIFLFVLSKYRAYQFQPLDLNWKNSIVLAGLLVITLFVGKIVTQFAIQTFIEHFERIPAQCYIFVFPFVAVPMTIRLVMGIELAVLFSMMMAICLGFNFDQNLLMYLHLIIGGLFGSYTLSHCKQRSSLFRAGIKVGAILASTSIIVGVYAEPALSNDIVKVIYIALSGFLGGAIAPFVVLALLPALEFGLGYISDLRLLELANLDHPLLKDLLVKAPGTFHHSIILGSLVEAAADKIGANGLAARVASYYHDIGKMDKPRYFVENQSADDNPHDRLTPNMSVLVIKEHVKKGVEMAEQYRLPKIIIEGIQEHHGTSLITYFYRKTREAVEAEGGDPNLVNESEFRYDGPKPQTKETALIMMADGVEAATRSIVEPSSPRLTGTVQNILNKLFVDGQLSECGLNLHDLDEIAKAFIEVLNGIYHVRLEYQLPANKERIKDNAREKKAAAARKHTSTLTSADENLKRLGNKK